MSTVRRRAGLAALFALAAVATYVLSGCVTAAAGTVHASRADGCSENVDAAVRAGWIYQDAVYLGYTPGTAKNQSAPGSGIVLTERYLACGPAATGTDTRCVSGACVFQQGWPSWECTGAYATNPWVKCRHEPSPGVTKEILVVSRFIDQPTTGASHVYVGTRSGDLHYWYNVSGTTAYALHGAVAVS